MVYLSLLYTLVLLFSCGGRAATFDASNQTGQFMKVPRRRETPVLSPPYLQLPVFVDSRHPLVDKENFSPSRGTGQEPLPELVREVLLPNEPQTRPPGVSGVSVRALCRSGKILVQVDKQLLGPGETQSHVKLGTCRPSKSTRAALYFEYNFDMCGTTRMIINNQVAYLNTLHYDPPTLQGPIRRSAPFSLPVSCYYNKYQYSYKIGYKPKLRMRKILKPMRHQAKFLLTPRNAQWERLSPSDPYVLGEPMYFEAEGPSMSQDQRLYVHTCYATPEKSHNSKPQFPVVENFGCMAESKEGRSRFIPYKTHAVRFSVDAFIFEGMMDQALYMHCSMSVGSSVPTPTTKSCNYDTFTQKWVELYGKDSVCTCCDSSCSAASAETKIVSSRPWTIDTEVKHNKGPKRKKVHATTKKTSQPETSRETPHPEVTQPGKVEDKEWEWQFGGGGVQWFELEEEEEQVKGSAAAAAVVVEEDEEEDEEDDEDEDEEDEEVVTQSHTIFEDVFDFAK